MDLTLSAQAASLVAAIRAKVPMMALLGGPKQAAKVEIAIRELATAQIAFVRIANPLASPLSLERLVLQITRDEVDEISRDEAERVLRALIARSDTLQQVVVVVEQAETLAPEALEFLHGLPELSHPSLAPVQVALVGGSALGARIGDNRIYIIRNPADPAPATAVQTSTLTMQASRPCVYRKGRSRSKAVLLAGLSLGGMVACLFMIQGPFQPHAIPRSPTLPSPLTPTKTASLPTTGVPQQTAKSTPHALPVAPLTQSAGQQLTETQSALPETSLQVSSAELPIPEPPSLLSAPILENAATSRVWLYREFTTFLAARSVGRLLSQAERKALFQEYLARHQAMPSSSQTAAPASIGRHPSHSGR